MMGLRSGTSNAMSWSVDAVPPPPSTLAPNLAAKRVLIVDDEDDVRELLRRLLEAQGLQVVEATRVFEALELLADMDVDVVVSDIGMPELDGHVLVQELRLMPLHRSTPTIALTAFGKYEDRARAMASGFDAHVTKPIDSAEFLALLSELLTDAHSPQ